jgi:putative NIF3 family GTP cyclohydrolase 1 type 2
MTTVHGIIREVENRSGHSLNPDEGVQHGSANTEVSGATICWMATPSAIRAAGESGHNLLIAHESLYYPCDVPNITNPPKGWREWKVNRQRKELLDRYRLTFLRLHGSLDEICIFDSFAYTLGLGKPVFMDGLVKVYEISERSFADLIKQVKESFGLSVVRVTSVADLDMKVRRVGLPWGGLGLFVNVDYQQRLVEQYCDVFIAGEADNYGFRFAQECGIPMIETSHELSENPGLYRFTDMLSGYFAEIPFRFYENKSVWRAI